MGIWEGYRWLWMRQGWTWPFVVDDTSMPQLHSIFQALFRSHGKFLLDLPVEITCEENKQLRLLQLAFNGGKFNRRGSDFDGDGSTD